MKQVCGKNGSETHLVLLGTLALVGLSLHKLGLDKLDDVGPVTVSVMVLQSTAHKHNTPLVLGADLHLALAQHLRQQRRSLQALHAV